MSEDRVVRLEGVHNFRDYGGYPVAGGGRLRRGLLWRSGQHHHATDPDLERIGALNLATVFDLRSDKEREIAPCRRPEGFAGRVHIAELPTGAQAPHISVTQTTAVRDPAGMRMAMIRTYEDIVFRPELVPAIRRYFAELARGGGASLVNCMAGKDRTGVSVALLHLAVGVHRDDAIEDYLLTNTAGDVEARIAAGRAAITAYAGPIAEEAVRVLMGVEAEYLDTALAAVTEKHGSIDGYMRDVLGVDDAAKAKLREALVE